MRFPRIGKLLKTLGIGLKRISKRKFRQVNCTEVKDEG